MEHAPDLEQLTARLLDGVSRGDAATMEAIISHQEPIVMIGTDPDEWWESLDSLRQVLHAQAEAGITIVPGQLRAYREGSVGWVAGRPTVRLPDGTAVPVRMTAIFRHEDGAWKLVQEHVSLGVSNQEVIGQQLTT